MADHKHMTTKLLSALTLITMEFGQKGKVNRQSMIEFDTAMGDFEAHIGELTAQMEQAKGLYERANAMAMMAGIYDALEKDPIRGEEKAPVKGSGNIEISIGSAGIPGPKISRSADALEEPPVDE